MGTQRIRSLVVGGLLAAGLAACGGPKDPPPGPLGRHFEDTFLVQIAVDQRKDEIAAKQAYDVAVLEQQKAKADLDNSRQQLDLAKNERDKANIDEKSAESNEKTAQASADMTKVAQADKDLKAAQSAKEAAQARYDYLDAYRKWLEKLERYTEHNMYWKEAQYELAQAKLAQSNNIQPKGFKLDDYATQESDRGRKTQDAKQRADSEKEAAEEARSKWLTMQKNADALLGKHSDYADPMANQKGVDFTVGTQVHTDTSVTPVQDPSMGNGNGGGNGSGEGSDQGGTGTP
jgi:hypothetical protein